LIATTTDDASVYGDEFFAGIEEGARRSANEVAQLIKQLFAPGSVVDIGGGAGHWAAAMRDAGIADILSVDGPWVPQAARVVPPEQFREHDLSLPLTLERRFDVAMSLETAEHLPPEAAPGLVRALTQAAPIIVFSAALPGQGGDRHINEQRASHWASLFAEHGYACFTDLRSHIWNNESIEVWYRQNLLCFISGSELHRWTDRLNERRNPGDPLLDVAHPDLVLRQKGRIDRAEAYAARLEKDAARLEKDAARLRQESGQLRADLAVTREKLGAITNSRLWRGRRGLGRLFHSLRNIF